MNLKCSKQWTKEKSFKRTLSPQGIFRYRNLLVLSTPPSIYLAAKIDNLQVNSPSPNTRRTLATTIEMLSPSVSESNRIGSSRDPLRMVQASTSTLIGLELEIISQLEDISLNPNEGYLFCLFSDHNICKWDVTMHPFVWFAEWMYEAFLKNIN